MTDTDTTEPSQTATRTGDAHATTAAETAAETDRVRPVPETVVPPSETPAATCPYCDRPFRAARQCALHVGDAHTERCTPAEQEAYEAAVDDEDDDLFVFHLKVVFAIGTVYAVFIVIYIIAFSIAG